MKAQKAQIVALTAAMAIACRKAGLARDTSLRSWGIAPEATSRRCQRPSTVREMNCPAHLWLADADARPCRIGPRPLRAMNGEPVALSTLVKDIPDTFTVQDADAELADFDRAEQRPHIQEDDTDAEQNAAWLYANGWTPEAFLDSKKVTRWNTRASSGVSIRPRFPRSTTQAPTTLYQTAPVMVSRIVWAAAKPGDVATYDALVALWADNPVQNKRTEPTASPYYTHEQDADSEPMDFGPLPEPQEEDGFGLDADGDSHLTERAACGKRSRASNALLLDRLHNKYRELCAISTRHNIRALVGWYQVGFGAIVTAHYNGLTMRTQQRRREVMFTIGDMDAEARRARLAACGPEYTLKLSDWRRASQRADKSLTKARAVGYRLSHPAASQWSRRFAQWALAAGLLDGESCTVASILRKQAAQTDAELTDSRTELDLGSATTDQKYRAPVSCWDRPPTKKDQLLAACPVARIATRRASLRLRATGYEALLTAAPLG